MIYSCITFPSRWLCCYFITWLLNADSSSVLRCTANILLTTVALSKRSRGRRLRQDGLRRSSALWDWPSSTVLTTNNTSWEIEKNKPMSKKGCSVFAQSVFLVRDTTLFNIPNLDTFFLIQNWDKTLMQRYDVAALIRRNTQKLQWIICSKRTEITHKLTNSTSYYKAWVSVQKRWWS